MWAECDQESGTAPMVCDTSNAADTNALAIATVGDIDPHEVDSWKLIGPVF